MTFYVLAFHVSRSQNQAIKMVEEIDPGELSSTRLKKS